MRDSCFSQGRRLRCFSGIASDAEPRIDPNTFREELLAHGAVMLRNAVDVRILSRLRESLTLLFCEYAAPPSGCSPQRVLVEDDWDQIKRSHVFDHTFKRITSTSYFDIIRGSGLWDLAAEAFPESAIIESGVANSRRIVDGDLHDFWDKPIEFHIDAQVFYDDRLSINFWTPLDSCGVDAPGLQIILLGVEETKSYLEYNPAGYDPTPNDIALMHKFRCRKMEMDAIDRHGLSAHICKPEFQVGDVLAFTNFTMHATHYEPAMRNPRLSVEVRIDLPGYRLHR